MVKFFTTLMAQQFIYQHGVKLLEENPDIKKQRVFFNFDIDALGSLDLTNENITNPFISQLIMRNNLPIDHTYKIKTFFKLCSDGKGMGWHQDDVAVYKNSKKYLTDENQSRFQLFSNETPKYSMVFYLNTYGIDFVGGEFCFVDLKIKPNQGMGIFFDSREVHKITEVTEGLRKSCVIKFYSTDFTKKK